MAYILKRKDVILTIVAFCFGLTVIPYFLEIPSLTFYSNQLNKITAVITSAALLIALYAQTKRAAILIQRRTSGWFWQVCQMISLYVMIALGLTLGQTSMPYKWLQLAFIMSCSTVLYSIPTFYMVSAGARAFRAKSIQAGLFLLAAGLCLLGQAPMTETYTALPMNIRTFLNLTFAKAAGRVFVVGLGISGLVLGVRVLMGKEPATVGITEEVG